MVFNQVVGGLLAPRTTPPPAPIYRNVVYYPNGRYVLRGDGVYTTAAPVPPPPPRQ